MCTFTTEPVEGNHKNGCQNTPLQYTKLGLLKTKQLMTLVH